MSNRIWPSPIEALCTVCGNRHSPPMCSPTKLTPRVREVAVLVNQQLTDREIAARLTLSVWTVQDYVKKARRLTGSRSRLGVALAIERGAA